MVAAVELKNMQSVKIQMMLASQKLETIGAKQRDLRKRLHDHDKKDIPPAKKMKTWTVSVNDEDYYLQSSFCILISLSVSVHVVFVLHSILDAVYSSFLHFLQVMTTFILLTLSVQYSFRLWQFIVWWVALPY